MSSPKTLMALVHLRMPKALITTIDGVAVHYGMTRSALLRELIVASLTQRKHWPPDEYLSTKVTSLTE